MSKKNKISKPTGRHTSISNIHEESLRAKEADFFVANPVSEEPEEGKDPKTNKSNVDGSMAVPGHKKTSMEDAIFTAPDTSKLEISVKHLLVNPKRQYMDLMIVCKSLIQQITPGGHMLHY